MAGQPGEGLEGDSCMPWEVYIMDIHYLGRKKSILKKYSILPILCVCLSVETWIQTRI